MVEQRHQAVREVVDSGATIHRRRHVPPRRPQDPSPPARPPGLDLTPGPYSAPGLASGATILEEIPQTAQVLSELPC